jgi:hypothetical protein
MLHLKFIEIQNHTTQAQMKRALNATLADHFNSIKSFEINSKKVPSVMHLKFKLPFNIQSQEKQLV